MFYFTCNHGLTAAAAAAAVVVVVVVVGLLKRAVSGTVSDGSMLLLQVCNVK